MKSKRGIFIFIILLIAFLFFSKTISALAIGPGKVEFNFEPGMEKTITYKVFGSSNDLEIYTVGDLAKYITFDKTTIRTGDSFTATIKLPDKMKNPGVNSVYIGVREKFDPELVRGNIGTLVAIEVLINVYVPYPGRYLDINLISANANVGEPITFQLDLASKGTEDLTVTPKIEIYSSKGEQKTTLQFQERTIKSQEAISLKKTLDTQGYNPGNYKAVALVDYGVLGKDEEDFKIGDLNIDIVGYTPKLVIGKLQKFDIAIQSGWNDNIDGVYGEVVILNNSQQLASFKTTTTGLTPWENKTITGYVDTSNFTVGFYDANMTLFYFGKDRGSTTNKMVKLEFVKMKSLILWYFVGGAGLLIIIVLLGLKYFFKKKKSSRKK